MERERTILILDDEVIATMGLKAQLATAGFPHVSIASTYERAMELYREAAPDVAIVDINLESDKSGFDFIRDAPGVPRIVILTGYARSQYQEELKSVRHDRLLEKPVRIGTIVEALG